MARIRTGKPNGRPKGIWTPEIVRKRIQTTKLVQRLLDHIDDAGKTPMLRTQLEAARFLVERVVPKAAEPQDINLTGDVSVYFPDPTNRPVGYERKRSGA